MTLQGSQAALLSIIIASVMLVSCSSTKQSASTTYVRKSKRQNGQFIDNISINAGSGSQSAHYAKSSVTKKTHVSRPVQDLGKSNISSENIESASELQLKYAVRLNTPVENLTDINTLQEIEHWWGTPYNFGGSTENGIDCSALCQTFLKDLYQLQIPRSSQDQFNSAVKIDLSEVKQGDLVFFGSGSGISHVGMYLMNNKFVHASTSQGVMISDLDDKYWKARFKGVGRYANSLSMLR